MIRYKFSRKEHDAFAATLRKRVKAHFTDQGLCPKGNAQMHLKTAVALSVYFIPFFFILFGGISSIPVLYLFWMFMGFGKAFIGTSVMHDVIHGSYSSHKVVNQLMRFSALVVGVYPNNWRVQHNVLHHTYTNIEHADEDISPLGVLRFSPHQKHQWFHKYQHIYVIFFYCIFTLTWALLKDFVKMYKYRKEGFIKDGSEFRKHMSYIVLSKIAYFSVFLGLPMWILPVPGWQVMLMFLFMHCVTGFTLSMVFQLAHIMPTSEFLEQEEQLVEENWFVHQLLTTSNYAMDNKIVSFFVGGLNFQVEHHLFPNICHVHYPEISKIVQQTTAEYNIPYFYEKTVGSAIITHFKMLKALGNGETGRVEKTRPLVNSVS